MSTSIKTELKKLKKGGFFRLTENGPLWVKDDYERTTKRYWAYKYEDVNHCHLYKGEKEVYAVCEFDLKKGCR